MKKIYTKPLISVEVMTLDQPIANANCNADPNTVQGLIDVGVFTKEMECKRGWMGMGEDGSGGWMDMNMDGDYDDFWDRTHDTVCYHSNVTIAFIS